MEAGANLCKIKTIRRQLKYTLKTMFGVGGGGASLNSLFGPYLA